jgi:hypothetical protein
LCLWEKGAGEKKHPKLDLYKSKLEGIRGEEEKLRS